MQAYAKASKEINNRANSNIYGPNVHGQNCECFSCTIAYVEPKYQVKNPTTDIPPMSLSITSLVEAIKNTYKDMMILPGQDFPKVSVNKPSPSFAPADQPSQPRQTGKHSLTNQHLQDKRISNWAEKEGTAADDRIVGHVYGLRHFRRGDTPDHIKGAWGGKWYSPRQNAKCKPHGNGYARHKRTCKVSPGMTCYCGINMYDIITQEDYMNNNLYGLSLENSLVALMKGWGRTVEHKLGYRTQKALIIAIYSRSANHLDFARNAFKGQKREPLYTTNYHEMLEWCELHKAQDDMNKENVDGSARQTRTGFGRSGTNLHYTPGSFSS